MNKVFCDKCGNEIKKSWIKGIGQEHLNPVAINGTENYHLCPTCYNKFHNWRRS